MRTSIATVCLSGSLEDKMDACAEAGFDGIEVFEPDLVASDLSPEEVRARAHGSGSASTSTSRSATSRASPRSCSPTTCVAPRRGSWS